MSERTLLSLGLGVWARRPPLGELSTMLFCPTGHPLVLLFFLDSGRRGSLVERVNLTDKVDAATNSEAISLLTIEGRASELEVQTDSRIDTGSLKKAISDTVRHL